jgi:hypothetical protein
VNVPFLSNQGREGGGSRPGWCGHAGLQERAGVQRLQQLGEVAGLVVLDVDLEVIQQAPAVLGDAQEMDPGAVGPAGAAGGLAIHGHRS